MPNLCGVNQKLLAEALQQVRRDATPSEKRKSPLKATDSTVSVRINTEI
jgi:hypothetical protein